MKLYELTQNYNGLLEKLYDSDIDEQTIIDTLDSIENAIEVKASGIAKINAIIENDITGIDNEIKRLQSMKKTMENRQKRLLDYMFAQLKVLGKETIKADLFTVSIHKNPPKLIIDHPGDIPASFLTIIPQSYQINNAEVKKALAAGESVPGAHIEQGEHLSIK
jgi:hypothetical protein